MEIVKGSDLVELFSTIQKLDEFARFMSIRSATHHALEHDVSEDDLRMLLRGWMTLTESSAPKQAQSDDAVARGAEVSTE